MGFRASAELAKGSARTTQLVRRPVLQRKDIDVCVLQSLRANTAKKVTMDPNMPLCSCKFSFSVVISPNIPLGSCKLSVSVIIPAHHTLR